MNLQDPQQREIDTLRLLLSFIAKDLGIDDVMRTRHKIELTREIRKAIRNLKGEEQNQ